MNLPFTIAVVFVCLCHCLHSMPLESAGIVPVVLDYQTDTHSRHEEGQSGVSVRGSYQWMNDDKIYRVDYEADEAGYRPRLSIQPVSKSSSLQLKPEPAIQQVAVSSEIQPSKEDVLDVPVRDEQIQSSDSVVIDVPVVVEVASSAQETVIQQIQSSDSAVPDVPVESSAQGTENQQIQSNDSVVLYVPVEPSAQVTENQQIQSDNSPVPDVPVVEVQVVQEQQRPGEIYTDDAVIIDAMALPEPPVEDEPANSSPLNKVLEDFLADLYQKQQHQREVDDFREDFVDGGYLQPEQFDQLQEKYDQEFDDVKVDDQEPDYAASAYLRQLYLYYQYLADKQYEQDAQLAEQMRLEELKRAYIDFYRDYFFNAELDIKNSKYDSGNDNVSFRQLAVPAYPQFPPRWMNAPPHHLYYQPRRYYYPSHPIYYYYY